MGDGNRVVTQGLSSNMGSNCYTGNVDQVVTRGMGIKQLQGDSDPVVTEGIGFTEQRGKWGLGSRG